MNRVALITGGSRGIGYGIALQLANAGYDLVINGVREADAVKDQLGELEKAGVRVLYCRADISSKEDRTTMLDEINSFYGQLDILINNAGDCEDHSHRGRRARVSSRALSAAFTDAQPFPGRSHRGAEALQRKYLGRVVA